jgi:hypothetical protein
MKRLAVLLLAATPLVGQAIAQTVPVARVAGDAKVIDRVAEASRKDLPRDLLKRIVEEDIDLLRGKRADGSYTYAGYERLESGRVSQSFSVDPGRKESVLEVKGPSAYRLAIIVPSRRMLVTKNKRVFIDRVDVEYVPVNGSATKTQSVNVGAWIDPGQTRNIDLDDISRQATAKVTAKADDSGYGNVTLALIQARIFDHPDSPYADAVQSAKAVLRALDHDDVGSIRAMAMRIFNALQPGLAASAPASTAAPAVQTVEVIAPRADSDVYAELQAIEDLLTGSDAERRQGLDRLHQLLRKLRK